MSCYCGQWDCHKCGNAPPEYHVEKARRTEVPPKLRTHISILRAAIEEAVRELKPTDAHSRKPIKDVIEALKKALEETER